MKCPVGFFVTSSVLQPLHTVLEINSVIEVLSACVPVGKAR